MKTCLLFTSMAFAIGFLSCKNPQKIKTTDGSVTSIKKTIKPSDSIPVPLHFYLKSDSLCILINKKSYCIPGDAGINYKHALPGIYQISNRSIKRNYGLFLNNKIYFTTYDDVGKGHRGYLYIFDMKNKSFINDKEFKRDYLYSSAGVFIIDTGMNRIFTINNPEWYDKNKTFSTCASMYSVSGKHYKFFRNIYETGEQTDDSLLVKFFDKSLTNAERNGK